MANDIDPPPGSVPGQGKDWFLTPRAARFVGEALDFHEGSAGAAVDRAVPPREVRRYDAALDAYIRHLTARLDGGDLDEDDAADVGNDLMFLKAIHRDLRRHRLGDNIFPFPAPPPRDPERAHQIFRFAA